MRGLLKPQSLDLEHVVAAVAVDIDPFADGVAVEARQQLLRPIAAIGEDATRGRVIGHVVGDLRGDDEFDREDRNHHARHAVWQAEAGRITRQAADGAVANLFKQRLIFRRQRRLLTEPRRLGRIPRRRDVGRSAPLARPVREFRGVLRVTDRYRGVQQCKGRDERKEGVAALVTHGIDPAGSGTDKERASRALVARCDERRGTIQGRRQARKSRNSRFLSEMAQQ